MAAILWIGPYMGADEDRELFCIVSFGFMGGDKR